MTGVVVVAVCGTIIFGGVVFGLAFGLDIMHEHQKRRLEQKADARLINALHRGNAFYCACCVENHSTHVRGLVTETHNFLGVTIERIQVSQSEWLRLIKERTP